MNGPHFDEQLRWLRPDQTRCSRQRQQSLASNETHQTLRLRLVLHSM